MAQTDMSISVTCLKLHRNTHFENRTSKFHIYIVVSCRGLYTECNLRLILITCLNSNYNVFAQM